MACGKGCANHGPYTHIVTRQRLGTLTKDDGRLDKTDANWSTVHKLRVRFITPSRTMFGTASGREIQVGNQLQAVFPMVLMAPFTSAAFIPLPDERLKMGTRIFNVISACRVNESEREVQIEVIERK